ncbi:hypothetical protein BGX27_009798 [Mortierella sp. AM989]|nr:hypothetical protein BGX27_009798 [Mortierella sp. AM989]
MADSASISQYYRKKLEQHELTPQEWSAVRFAVIKHTLIGGNLMGLSVGAAIAMESGMKTVENRLQGSGSELLYLMDRYSKATMKERLGDQAGKDTTYYENDESEQAATAPRMIRIQDPSQK